MSRQLHVRLDHTVKEPTASVRPQIATDFTLWPNSAEDEQKARRQCANPRQERGRVPHVPRHVRAVVIHTPGFQLALIGMAAIGAGALVVIAAFGAGLYKASRVLESP